MTIQTVCFCDECERDLAETSNCVDYRITIQSERIPSRGGAVTLMNLEPQISCPIHFCSEKCMKAYFRRVWHIDK